MRAIAQRVVWFESPEDTLAQPRLFLSHVMTYADLNDAWKVRNAVGLEAFTEVLQNPPPGILDARSWSYWNLLCGLGHRPMPERKF